MAKPLFSPDSTIQRAKPLFELSDAAAEISRSRVKKPPAKIVLPAPVQRNVPFDSDAILEAVECPPSDSRSSLEALTNLSLELADYEDLFTDSTSSPTGGGISALSPTDDRRQSRRKSADTVGFESDTESSGASIVLAPLKAPPQRMARAQRMRSAPRVAQRYQLRDPDQLIAEATERRRLTEEILELENHRRRKEEELARIYKREKKAEAQRAHSLKIIRTRTAPKKIRVCNPPFTSDLLLQHKDHVSE